MFMMKNKVFLNFKIDNHTLDELQLYYSFVFE